MELRCYLEDWTPLFEEPHLNDHGPYTVNKEALDKYNKARANLIEAHNAMMQTANLITVKNIRKPL